MPTNVTPEYKKAKEQFQKARDPEERLTCLKEMLRTVPKHKGTDHLQAEIKTRIKQLTEELSGPRKGAAKTGPAHTIHPEGAAQVALVGPPNSGKSSLHRRLTGSHAEVGPYAHTTHTPFPGMFPYQDIQFQIVDLPPVSATYMESWMPNALQPARAALLVVDLSAPGCVENVAAIRERLDSKRVSLTERWPGAIAPDYLDVAGVSAELSVAAMDGTHEASFEFDDPFRSHLPTLLVANKRDLVSDPDEITALEELIGVRYPALAVSAETGEGLDRIGPALFQGLGVVRVYTKAPGRAPEMDRPFTVFAGDTIADVAALVHRELAGSLKYARVWGSAKFDGQRVGKDHVVGDGDIVELHA
jgi:ribosome-interacting GTPase 1